MPTTTLDDLKLAWNELSQKLERQNALALHQFKENKLARFRSGLRPLVLGQLIQLIIGAVITACSAQFWVNHFGRPQLLICGLLLQAYGLMFIAFAVRDLVLIRRIDYAAPIVVIQKQLAELRAWHIRAAAWYGLTGSVIWLPVMIVMLHAWGADLVDRQTTQNVVANFQRHCLSRAQLWPGASRSGARKVRPVATSQLDRSHSESCANNAGRDREIRTRAELILANGWG